jgi:hypothetical protein
MFYQIDIMLNNYFGILNVDFKISYPILNNKSNNQKYIFQRSVSIMLDE